MYICIYISSYLRFTARAHTRPLRGWSCAPATGSVVCSRDHNTVGFPRGNTRVHPPVFRAKG